MRQLKILESITSRDTEALASFLRDISAYSVPDDEEEVLLARRIREGDRKALDELVTRNLRFVVSVAKQCQGNGLPLSDLIAEGCIGLITAAERFDETRGFKFCSYAVWWIRQAIMKAVTDHSYMLRLPSNQFNAVRKLQAAKQKFAMENGRDPSEEELSEMTGIDVDKLPLYDTSTRSLLRLDARVSDDDHNSLSDYVPSSAAPTDNTLEKESMHHDIQEALLCLSPRERTVLTMIYGLDGNQYFTLDEIAYQLGMTRERTRQIRENALRHMRENKKCAALLKAYCA